MTAIVRIEPSGGRPDVDRWVHFKQAVVDFFRRNPPARIADAAFKGGEAKLTGSVARNENLAAQTRKLDAETRSQELADELTKAKIAETKASANSKTVESLVKLRELGYQVVPDIIDGSVALRISKAVSEQREPPALGAQLASEVIDVESEDPEGV